MSFQVKGPGGSDITGGGGALAGPKNRGDTSVMSSNGVTTRRRETFGAAVAEQKTDKSDYFSAL